ncbi:MAG: hypothetical protein AUK35_07465 [Zetaproteobacteria bacterium CG2_30_46_52]|nr:MAG: hypothetical protein AUK35_07465 [Zetaproteobacteria bacterium CG2_30_46_52]
MEDASKSRAQRHERSITVLRDLLALHPNDPTLLSQLAKQTAKFGHEIAAIMMAKKAYQILKKDNMIDAAKLVDDFGIDISDGARGQLISRIYSPLADAMGIFYRKRNKVHLREGAILFQQGDPSDCVYLVLEGELAINSEANGIHTLVNYIHKGCLLGKSAQQHLAQTRTATAVAIQPSIVLRFTPDDLEKAFTKFPQLKIQFAKEAMLHRRLEVLSSIPLFVKLPIDLRFLLARRSWSHEYAVDETIKASNKLMRQAQLMVSGVVHLYDQEDEENTVYCGRIGAGEIMGLSKLMRKQATTLVIKAETKVEVACIDFIDLEDVMELDKEFRKSIVASAEHYSKQIIRTILLQKSLKEE